MTNAETKLEFRLGDRVRWKVRELNFDRSRGLGIIMSIRTFKGRQRLTVHTRTGAYLTFAEEVELDNGT